MASSLAFANEQSRSAVRQHRATECLKHDPVKLNAVIHRPHNDDGATSVSQQIYSGTMSERAKAAPRADLAAALAGIAELITARNSERSFARMQAELAALSREQQDRVEGEAAPAPTVTTPNATAEPALPLLDAWQERADING